MTRATWALSVWAGLACVCSWLPTTSADVLHATRTQPMYEVSHSVDIRIDKGVATYKVQRVFANPGKLADEAGIAIDLPSGAAATGLRIRAHDTWYDGELMERDKAAALYHELTGLGAYKPKDPALLQWLWADKLYLQIFPVMPGGVSTVEYTLTVPTRYAGGRYWVSYPRTDVAAKSSDETSLALATPTITVHPSWDHAAIVIDGKRTPADTSYVLTPPVREPWADLVQASPDGSYVASRIDVPASSHTTGKITSAKVTVDIAHTYQGDLKVELVTPQGASIVLHDRKGGTANDLRFTRDVPLPAGTTAAGTWRLVASDHAALDTGSIDHWSLDFGDTVAAATDVPVFIPDAPESGNDAGVASISITPPKLDTWTVRLGRAVASSEHAFTRVEIDTAPELVPLPKKAQVVFVVDASYSMTEAGVAAQLDVARAYLSHIPDAEVELVAFRRTAARVFGTFVAATDFDMAVEAAKADLALGNGSALDEGAHLALDALADRKGPRRVVLLSDELLRSTLAPAAALAALAKAPRDVVVHLVVPGLDHDDRATLARRADTDTFAPLATRHHGIAVSLGGLPAHDLKSLAPVVLELVRPTRIEHLAIVGFKQPSGGSIDETLNEGEGVRAVVLDAAAPTHVTATGMLWSDPIKLEVDADDKFSRCSAAFVFGADEHQQLSHDEQLALAFYGRAVSPVTSYVAFEPGTRPSSVGLDYGTVGHGSGTGSGYGFGGGSLSQRRRPDLGSLVDISSCKAGPPKVADVELTVETTRDEIVDVQVTTGASAFATCVAEAVWAARLDSRFNLERETFVLDY